MARKILCGGVLAVLGCAVAVGAADLAAPAPVSPGSGQQVETVPGSWPTFSWGAVAEASGYRLVVYELTAEGELGRAVIRQRLAAGASSWSPPLRQGLEPGASYAWTVGAVARKGKMLWSEPALFQVAPGPGERELEEALALVQRYWVLQGDGAGEVKATSADRSARQQKSRAEDGVSTPHLRAPAATDLSVAGGVVAASFTGEGSTLTDLSPANLSPGTAAIDITGTAANVTGTVGIAQGGTGATTAPAACANLGAATAASLVAHASGSDHDARYYTESELQTGGSAAVDWGNLTGLPTTTKGDLLVEDGADVVRLGVGTDGQAAGGGLELRVRGDLGNGRGLDTPVLRAGAGPPDGPDDCVFRRRRRESAARCRVAGPSLHEQRRRHGNGQHDGVDMAAECELPECDEGMDHSAVRCGAGEH